METLDVLSIHPEMIRQGVPCENHCLDLYVPVNKISRAIVRRYQYRQSVETFKSEIDGKQWFDIPFGFHTRKGIWRADYDLNDPAAESERRRREDECAARKPAISLNDQI